MPYLGDDTFNAYFDGWIGYDRLSVFRGLHDFFTQTNLDVGRFYPIYPLLMVFDFHVVRDVLVLKILVLAAILTNAFTFYVLVRALVPQYALATLVALPATLQIRFFHDPIVQFSLHMQLAWEFALLAALAITWYARARRALAALLGTLAYACAALTYEATYAFVVAYVALVFVLVRDARARILPTVGFAAVPLACSIAAVIVRTHVPVADSSPYAIHADVPAIARTIGIQAFGALPLGFALLDPVRMMPPFAALFENPQAWTVAIFTGLAAFATFSFSSPVAKPRQLPATLAFAFVLVLASSVLIALSRRWQHELVLGLAYTPVYFADYGIALAIAAIGTFVATTVPRSFGPACVALLLACTIGATYRANALVLDHYHAWSLVVPHALDAGILADARAGDTVYLDDSYPAHARDEGGRWNTRYYLFAHAGTRLTPAHLAMLPARPPANSFALVADVTSFSDGSVIAGPIASVAVIDRVDTALVSQADRFVATSVGSRHSAWISRCGAIPIQNVLRGSYSALVPKYDDAFSFPERDGSDSLRWARGAASIAIENPTATMRHALIAFTIRPANAAGHVRVSAPRFLLDRSAGADVHVAFPIAIARFASAAISLQTDNAPVPGNPGGRVLQYEVRNLKLTEPSCS